MISKSSAGIYMMRPTNAKTIVNKKQPPIISKNPAYFEIWPIGPSDFINEIPKIIPTNPKVSDEAAAINTLSMESLNIKIIS